MSVTIDTPVGLFDCDLLLGGSPGLEGKTSPDELRARLDSAGIGGGLVSSMRALLFDLTGGNDEVCALAEAYPECYPAGVLDLRDPVGAAAEIERLAENGVKAFRITPDAQRVPPTAPSLHYLASVLAERGLVALVEGDLRTLWQPFVGRDAKVVFLDARVDDLGDLLLLCRDEPGFHASTRMLTGVETLEKAVYRLGAERLLFGSAGPLYEVAPTALRLHCSGLGSSEVELIASENARRLLRP
ncbi:putative TIM-barrel fold metal-dependent hydrolase [Tamaricihabitans halophyticus]|uniref:Putative TIM-barrel fold metal-dependent hydrolase n=1 Tax=Tamaricihabitans halophyticus TaxID=1262583 RepID=A0A4R2QVD3_9PSEU|nr:amidohydrolase family protein [Tamaricihabitans halophyticus]TCP54003.1 putative TIM-barrel fold metal-dependent hydrolase [Tamaricihabitans halophyticus]